MTLALFTNSSILRINAISYDNNMFAQVNIHKTLQIKPYHWWSPEKPRYVLNLKVSLM